MRPKKERQETEKRLAQLEKRVRKLEKAQPIAKKRAGTPVAAPVEMPDTEASASVE